MNNIGVVWDFDGTLAPDDSTMKTVEILSRGEVSGAEFFKRVKDLRGDARGPEESWKHIQAMDAPIWMYILSQLAASQRVPLNTEFFNRFVIEHIALFPGVEKFLREIKKLGSRPDFKKARVEIHHFIVSAGLKNLIELALPQGVVTETYGCRYQIVQHGSDALPESVPVYCVDETAKTRALFEIAKGTFHSKERPLNHRQKSKWLPFENMIYVGDGDTDIPALALTRERGGMGVIVYNPGHEQTRIDARLETIRRGYRADLITPADYSLDGQLFKFIESRCVQIMQRCEASRVSRASRTKVSLSAAG